MLPNDVFKRPGPHHAYEVDRAHLSRLREAFDALQLLGDVGPLAALLDEQPEPLLRDAYRLSTAYTYCLIDADFDLCNYGPMFSRMGIATEVGEPLIQQPDARAVPVSHVWFELSPYLPQRVAPAKHIYRELELVAPPASAWEELIAEMRYDDELFQEDDETDTAFEQRAAARAREIDDEHRGLVAGWREDCRAEVETFRSKLRAIGERDGLVATWHSEQGWL